MDKLRVAGLMLSAGVFGASMSTGSIYLYWKTETPLPLRQMALPTSVRTTSQVPLVLDIPTEKYGYLGRYVFNTETVDEKGEIVWSTKWVHYDPNIRYKFVAPIGLEPGSFSVLMNIDYALNPVARASGTVKFLNLSIEKEESNEGNFGAN